MGLPLRRMVELSGEIGFGAGLAGLAGSGCAEEDLKRAKMVQETCRSRGSDCPRNNGVAYRGVHLVVEHETVIRKDMTC